MKTSPLLPAGIPPGLLPPDLSHPLPKPMMEKAGRDLGPQGFLLLPPAYPELGSLSQDLPWEEPQTALGSCPPAPEGTAVPSLPLAPTCSACLLDSPPVLSDPESLFCSTSGVLPL